MNSVELQLGKGSVVASSSRHGDWNHEDLPKTKKQKFCSADDGRTDQLTRFFFL
jgi:hypothetical protein